MPEQEQPAKSKVEELFWLPRDPHGFTYNYNSIDGVNTLIAQGKVIRESLFQQRLHYFCELPETVEPPLPEDRRIFIRGNVALHRCRCDFPLNAYNWFITWRCSLQIDDQFIQTQWVTSQTEYPDPDEPVDLNNPPEPVRCNDDLRIWGIRDSDQREAARFWIELTEKMENKITALMWHCFPLIETEDSDSPLTRSYSTEILEQLEQIDLEKSPILGLSGKYLAP